jgi:hypothetical protein
MRTTKGRYASILGASLLLVGGIGASALVSGQPAEAATCVTGTSCTIIGTLTLGSGALTLTTPTSDTLTWAGTVTGLDQQLVDVVTADQTYLVDNASGTTVGWHVTVAATQFTTGTLTLLNAGTFATNGSLTSMTAATAPTSACLSGSTCTLPTEATTYPVAITTAATSPTPVTVYNATVGTGLGSITIGSVGWWLNLPSNTLAGTYTSTITMAVTSAP